MGHTIKVPETELEHVKKLYYDEQKTQTEIANIYNVGRSTMGRFFERHSLKVVRRSSYNRIDPGRDTLALDIENGLTNRQMCIKYMVNIQTVCNWMHKYGFDVNRDVFRYENLISEKDLRRLAEVERKTDREIAKIYDINFQMVHRLRKRYGIENYTYIQNPGHDILYNLYIEQEMTQKQIANKLGVAIGTVSRWLAKNNIRKRTRPEQIDLAIRQGGWRDVGMKARHTMLKNKLLKGSEPQQAMVIALITELEPLFEGGWEIVIGQQNWCILNGCAEVDIPIIAIKDDTILRIAVEVDGVYWHEEEDVIRKDLRLRDRGWTPFHYTSPAKEAKYQLPEIKEFVLTIKQYILDH